MDTPPKNNSPVFNYINSLSPIKPVRSLPIAQTFGSLSYSSPPSVFTSPHVSSHKGSRFKSDHNHVPASVGDEEALHETEPPQILQNECTTDLLKMCDGNVKQKSETPDWDAMISDSSDILIFDSMYDSEASRCFLERPSDSKTRSLGVAKSTLEPVINSNDALRRGVRRRCLDFDQTSVASSSRCVVPSIGLHFNAIALSSKDNNSGNEYPLSGNTELGLQGSITPVLNSQDNVRENETREDAGQGVEECPKSLALVELNQSSPKKKRQVSPLHIFLCKSLSIFHNQMLALQFTRRKFGQAGEGESSCKRCNCKRSKCLKLYCECFAAGVYCIGPCSCVDCFNKPIHEDIVMATRKQIESRNPLAFAPKVIRNSDSIMEVGDDATSKTPASARHKRGCNCKKSNCLKKYCECYQSGVGCSINCRCEGCKNAFGRKDVSAGSSFTSMDKENETSSRGRTEKQPSTPMPLRQPLAQLPISSNNMLLTHHHLHGASGSSLHMSQSFRRQDMSLMSHSKIGTITEERAENIENLIESPMTNMINAVSPNSKRVSLPMELSPWRRNGGRKLLLSIPTFPSLTPHH
ncbi:protein tesmin/TSO1-like CXC 3 isoform X1 [Brassica rapa]|uniref:protein tesmin/TSO1-like CXC 3 isoform X1 n=1 Tax=Brassica campestris TaxID=3711 RepID=UPI00142E0399|nr:protein tesmin/TSO1-like CXC 3 isoform X1 [Brassica rapa]